MKHSIYMQRCIELALNGKADVAPNPMVGAVIVYKHKIIGEGYHRKYGEAHAEVNAINSVVDKKLLSFSTLYVSLEPCNHFGKTPPCSELIIKYKIPEVVIGAMDENQTVKGNGAKRLKEAGVKVITGILEKECRELNHRFFFFQKNKSPYVILKWAQSKDGFIGNPKIPNLPISNEYSQQLVHKWRSEESAILVGTTTAAFDNPQLNVRHVQGKSPLRLVIDWENKLSSKLNLFDSQIPTLVFCRKAKKSKRNLEYIEIKKSKKDLESILLFLGTRTITSLFVEGGAKLLESFINKGLWNEARIFYSEHDLSEGIKAPKLSGKIISTTKIKNDTLVVFKNNRK